MLDVVIDGVPIMVLLSMVHVFVACHLLSIVLFYIIIVTTIFDCFEH